VKGEDQGIVLYVPVRKRTAEEPVGLGEKNGGRTPRHYSSGNVMYSTKKSFSRESCAIGGEKVGKTKSRACYFPAIEDGAQLELGAEESFMFKGSEP